MVSPVIGKQDVWVRRLFLMTLLAWGVLEGNYPAYAKSLLNTATVQYQIGPSAESVNSNLTELPILPPPAPATIELFSYDPSSNLKLPTDGGMYYGAGETLIPLPPPHDTQGNSVDTISTPVEVTHIYHLGEPVFIQVKDNDRNNNPLMREFIEIEVTTSTGDNERLRLQETGLDTGIFMGVIQGSGTNNLDQDGQLYLPEDSTVTVSYEDVYPFILTHKANALVDPFGIVFDSHTGIPVNGAIVELRRLENGVATTTKVFGDDKESTYPTKVISGPASAPHGPALFKSTDGGDVTDGKKVYIFPEGGVRFPFVPPGTYRLDVVPPKGYALRPKTAPPLDLDKIRHPNGSRYTVDDEGSFGDPFSVELDKPVTLDIPLDPIQTSLLLTKGVSKTQVSAGDFLQYTVTLENKDFAKASDVIVTDHLPWGMRFEKGSLRINGLPLPHPKISPDGQTLILAVGDIPATGKIVVTYVVYVSAGARVGPAVNRAIAMAKTADQNKEILSNSGEAVVQIREPFSMGDFTIVGRVVLGECKTPWKELQGVSRIRLMMEDGTSVMTDADGYYHFRSVRSGTHVVQMDRASLPPYLTAIPCIDNSRFGGNPFSQFVDAQGGTLWRADFYLGPKAPIETGFIGINLEGTMTLEERQSPVKRVTRQLDSEALFSTFSAKLRPSSLKGLKKIASEIGQMQIERIEVVGHSDSRGIHHNKWHLFRDNYALSHARAQSVVDYLIHQLKISPERIKSTGRGPDQPVATNMTREGRAKNRRVEVIVYLKGDARSGEPAGYGRHFHYRVAVDGQVASVKNVQVLALLPPGISYIPNSTHINGMAASDPKIEGNTLTYTLGDLVMNWKNYIEFSGWIQATSLFPQASERDPSCPQEGFIAQTLAFFEDKSGQVASTPTVQNRLLCPPLDTTLGLPDHSPIFIAQMSERQATTVTILPAPLPAAPESAIKPISDIEASGGGRDWLTGQPPGVAWLFPPWDHNPRSPSLRIVIKHAPGQNVVLTHQDQPVDSIYLDTQESNDTTAITIWRGVPLVEGDNLFRASIYNARGRLVDTLTRRVHYASQPARVELVPEKSVLIADGIRKPLIAVRLLDRHHRPVHAGMTGTYSVNAPYLPATTLKETQERQLAASDRFRPTFTVVGDEGIAPIELAPTLETRNLTVTIYFQNGEKERSEDLTVFMEPALRDWVVVGFAEGDVRYNTLSGNMQSLDPKDRTEGVVTDGKISLYAKGRILGKWLLTLAYNSDKQKEKRDTQGLFSGIDPDRFYTLYGDTAEPVYDAVSRKNLYLKLSREQFYFLFGDYDTGLTQTQLARYNRSFTGMKTEYHGSVLDVVAYQSETDLHFAKDEIQGNGTSGLYALSKRPLVINSEKVRIETRDRLKSEQIVQTRPMVRHLDYDIDYSAGTLFFREPILSRDNDFNPIFIVAEYETTGPSGENLVNTGGRVGVRLLDEHLTLGASQIRDETFSGRTDLSGVDMKVRVGSDSTLRVEGATSEGPINTQDRAGDAYLVEFEHHGLTWDTLTYLRRQDASFGVGQQSASEAGTQKEGMESRFRLTQQVSADTEIYRQENLAITAHRDLGKVQLRHQTDLGSVYAGGQFAADEFSGGTILRSEQAILGASRFLLDKKIEVQVASEFPLNHRGNESIDFPLRSRLGVNYYVTDSVRLLMAYEVADGFSYRTSTTRAGFQAVPWKGARLTQTINQTEISESGPRTFAALGLTQSLLISKRWGLDFSVDGNHTFNESGPPPPVFNANHPIASGGIIGEGPPPEDFLALSSGVTYRAEKWSWNLRAENRDAERTERYGISTNFLRQSRAGVAFGLSAQAFETKDIVSKTTGLLQNVSLSWAYRPLGESWSILDRLEFRQDALRGQTENPPLMNLNLPLLVNNRSRRLINNISINRVSKLWTNTSQKGSNGSDFYRNQRNQVSLYYGMKYVLDQIEGVDYKGYTDLTGFEWRYDLIRWLDVGFQAFMLHSWKVKNYSYGGGPSIGISPLENSWITLGYNVRGFYDRDFKDAGYTREGPYLQLRIKFDENSLGKKR